MASIGGQWAEFVFATDLHGDKLHQPTVDRLLKFLDEYKPKIVIFGGDLMDLRPLRKGASQEEKDESTRNDIDAGMQFFEDYFHRPALQKYCHDGNHDKRLPDLAAASDGVRSDYAAEKLETLNKAAKRLGVGRLPYHKSKGVLEIGELRTLHGYYHGNRAAQQHATTYQCCLFGHCHTIDEIPVAGMKRRVARGVGCLCQTDMEYNSTHPNTLRHANGWAYGAVNLKTGLYFAAQAEEVGGIWNLDVISR